MDHMENWYVLNALIGEEDVLVSLLDCKDVHLFYTTYEFWRSDRGAIEKKSLFPGYVFAQSNMNQMEFDDWLREQPIKKGFIKELKYGNTEALLPEEIAILKRLLNEHGVLKMSQGIMQNGKLHIVNGPLMDMDDYIVKYRSQSKIAELDLFFIGQKWKAGVEVVPSSETIFTLVNAKGIAGDILCTGKTRIVG